ncbi:MAG: TRAP transporter large permease subunit [Alphaproteobacteria bacterium]
MGDGVLFFPIGLDIGEISIALLVGILVLLAIGVPLGFASAFLGILVLFEKFGGRGLDLVMQRIYDLTLSYPIIAVPLFILMASLLERSGIARDMYDALSLMLRRIRGGVAVVTTVMAVIMAAMSGIIGGEIVLLGLVALPQMLRLKYNQNLAIGTICAGGSLGTMIPPSIVLIIFGLVTETSIDSLFTAAFIPGLMMGGLYIVYILVRTQLQPHLAPFDPAHETLPQRPTRDRLIDAALCLAPILLGVALYFPGQGEALQQALDQIAADAMAAGREVRELRPRELENIVQAIHVHSLAVAIFASAVLILASVTYLERFMPNRGRRFMIARGLLPPLLVVDVVLGSIYGGVTGITEAAGIGCVAALLLILIRSELNFTRFNQALTQTFRSVGTILWVTFGATILAGAYTLAGGPTYVAGSILGMDLPPMGIILMMMLIFIVLGMFMDWIGIVLLTMPVFMPIVTGLGYDPIWFGILFCINMQVSFLSPPFGPAAFYLKSVAPPHIDLIAIYRSFGPFICLQLVVLGLVLLFPEIALVFAR